MSVSASSQAGVSVCGAAVTGIEGHLLQVSAGFADGPPGLHITGLPDTSVRATRDRVRAAVVNSGLAWPSTAITVTVQPAALTRHRTGIDLPIAVAMLTAAGVIPEGVAARCVLVAELGLDGSLRPVRGVVPALHAAVRAGYARAVVAGQNGPEAVMVPGLDVLACPSLRAVVAWLRGDRFPPEPVTGPPSTDRAAGPPTPGPEQLAVAPQVRLALEASAAGGHHLCLTGPQGAGIPALAAGLARLLPPLTPAEAGEVTAIWSVAGLLRSGHALVTRPPFRAPHHTAAAIGGGGSGVIRPGEAALAHRGVLFLGDAPDFARDVLAMLRQPLHDGQITISRLGRLARFPARFLLVAGMTPCPCGGQPDCSCTPLQRRRYRARLTGALGSYLPIQLTIAPSDTASSSPGGEADSAARVAAARHRARHRLRGTPWQVSAEIPGPELRRSWAPAAGATAPVRHAVDLGEISTRSADQILRLAWTLADLAGQDRPGPAECGQALAFHLGVTR